MTSLVERRKEAPKTLDACAQQRRTNILKHSRPLSTASLALDDQLSSSQSPPFPSPACPPDRTLDPTTPMVKRVATPPPASGEPTIICITNPWPERGEWDFDTDSGSEVLLGQWLANLVNIDSIFAIHWRPKDDVIFVSVEKKDGRAYEEILGEHRWSEFLSHCPPRDRNKVSRIYRATFQTEREMQRLGWREKTIPPDWFEEDHSDRFVKPYPQPRYTDFGSQYGRPLPVPKQLVPPPMPVVGTTQWVSRATVSSLEAAPTYVPPATKSPAPPPPPSQPQPAATSAADTATLPAPPTAPTSAPTTAPTNGGTSGTATPSGKKRGGKKKKGRGA